MTLREQLNAKVRKESAEAMMEEIKELFLSAKFQDLKMGMSIRICFNSQGKIYHLTGNGYKQFKEDYDKETVKEVISLVKEEGLEVPNEDFEETGGVSIVYNPFK